MQKEYNKHTKIKEKNHTQARLWHKMNKKKRKNHLPNHTDSLIFAHT